nr:hypothetical protein [Tanacetum cinerariifolium]
MSLIAATCKSLEPHLCFLITGIRLEIHIKCACLAIRVTWAHPIGMKGFGMWDWGYRVTWGVGGVNGTVQ